MKTIASGRYILILLSILANKATQYQEIVSDSLTAPDKYAGKSMNLSNLMLIIYELKKLWQKV